MLCDGPPHILIPVVPFMESAFAIEGCVMTSGTGEITFTMAAVAVALIVEADVPRNRRSVVFTLL